MTGRPCHAVQRLRAVLPRKSSALRDQGESDPALVTFMAQQVDVSTSHRRANFALR